MTYRQLFDRMEQVAYGLVRFKIAAGDKVAICLPNCPESIFAFLGVLRRGAIVSPMGPDCRVLITTASLYAAMKLNRENLSHPQASVRLFLVGERGGEGFVFSSLYTSGPKKFEMEGDANQVLVSDADAFVEATQMTQQDCLLYASPWLSSHQQIISILASIIVGGSVILLERFSSKIFFTAIERFRVTAFSGAGGITKDLFESEEARRHDLSSLRFCVL